MTVPRSNSITRRRRPTISTSAAAWSGEFARTSYSKGNVMLFADFLQDLGLTLIMFWLALGMLARWVARSVSATEVAKGAGKGLVENILGGIFKKR